MMKTQAITIIAGLFMIIFSSCEKLENELDPSALNNPFDSESGIELMIIDSVQKFGGTVPYLKCYFHLNDQVFTTTSQIDRVILYRNGVELARLNPGNFSQFTDINSIFSGGQYVYELSLLMNDNSHTKKTTPYLVVF